MNIFNLQAKNSTQFSAVTATLLWLGLASLLGGCAGISGYQTVMNRVVVPGGSTQSIHVDCPAGKKVLGGGFNYETPDDIKIYSSDPSDGHGNLVDHSWDVIVHNAGTQARQTSAIAICAF
jgi:hypothetical protein